MFSLLSALFIRIRREEEGGGRGGRWALACAAHQVKQILCKGSIVFLGGELLWRGGSGRKRGESGTKLNKFHNNPQKNTRS